MHISKLDPRPPKPAASIVQTENGPAICALVTVADITNSILETIANKIADKVTEKLDARKREEEEPQRLV